jgi:PKD repeat protein
VSGGSKFGCAPFTVNFDNNSTGANTFNWDFGDGSVKTTTSAPESMAHTFAIPGIYLVKLRATNGCSDSTTTETITVYTPLVATLTTQKNEFCPFEPVQFNTITLTNVSWLWDFGDGNTSSQQNPSHSYSTAGIKNVRLTITQAFPDGTACGKTLSKQISVISKPLSGFSSNQDLLNCAPFNFKVIATPANSSNVEWNFGDPGSSDNLKVGHDVVHAYKKAGLYTVTQVVYNLTGCTDTLRQNIRITESPEVSFSLPDTIICGNTTPLDLINTTTYEGADMVSYWK